MLHAHAVVVVTCSQQCNNVHVHVVVVHVLGEATHQAASCWISEETDAARGIEEVEVDVQKAALDAIETAKNGGYERKTLWQ